MNFLCKGLLINPKEISSGGENTSFKSKISAVSLFSFLWKVIRMNSIISNELNVKNFPLQNSTNLVELMVNLSMQ